MWLDMAAVEALKGEHIISESYILYKALSFSKPHKVTFTLYAWCFCLFVFHLVKPFLISS